jgi:Uma2 family endonuclease
MLKSPLMAPSRPPDPPSTERNAPSVEAAFQAAPPEMVAEILDGELHLSPRPARPHTNVASNLGALLLPPFKLGRGGPGGWVILFEPELHLGPRPDALGGDKAPAHYDLAPDWVCEVLSQRTRLIDKGPKLRIYAREGVRNVWHVDPLAQTLDIFRLQGSHWHLVDSFVGEERVRAEPFEVLDLELALVWSR